MASRMARAQPERDPDDGVAAHSISGMSDPGLEDLEHLPHGSVLHVPGRGEFFVRDSGGDGPPVLLLHGWMFSADLNWGLSYQTLSDAGYRVLAMDHRGHGRGLRALHRFRLVDCADDAAAILRLLDCGPAIAVGYSMGGPIASMLARRHPDLVDGLVFCATAMSWQEPRMRRFWRTMGALHLVLALAPSGLWRGALVRLGLPDSETTDWVAAELSRGRARDMAEAGRELGRFDSRPWIGSLPQPTAVVVTTRDRSVPPRLQRELALARDAAQFEVAADHLAVSEATERFNAALLQALAAAATGGLVGQTPAAAQATAALGVTASA